MEGESFHDLIVERDRGHGTIFFRVVLIVGKPVGGHELQTSIFVIFGIDVGKGLSQYGMTGKTSALVSLSVGTSGHVVHAAHHTECTLQREVVVELVFVVHTEVGLRKSGVADNTIAVKIASSHIVVSLIVSTIYSQSI